MLTSQEYAQQITDCYAALNEKKSNVVWEILQHQETIYEWDHYPKGDVVDRKNYSQYFYHSHPSPDNDRVIEHGHFHVFSRLPSVDKNMQPLAISKKNLADSKKDNLCHLFAIAMNEHGYPTALFTVNHWVVDGIWYSAEDTIKMLEKFHIDSDKGPLLTNQWINAMTHLFKEPLKELLHHRDIIMQEWATEHPDMNVYEDRRLEITSVYPLIA